MHGENSSINKVPVGEGIVVTIREPLSRFCSGFYDRKRGGAPAYDNPVPEYVKVALDMFETPRYLAESIDTKEAQDLMFWVSHFGRVYTRTFGSVALVRERASDFYAIIKHDTFEADVAKFLVKLEMPAGVTLPSGDDAHVAPEGEDRVLSPLAISNLQAWYKNDIEIYEELSSMVL
jgi:hypothetical protein